VVLLPESRLKETAGSHRERSRSITGKEVKSGGRALVVRGHGRGAGGARGARGSRPTPVQENEAEDRLFLDWWVTQPPKARRREPLGQGRASKSWLLRTFDIDGEVIFVEGKPADNPALQGHTAPPSCPYPTSPSVAHEWAITTADENREAIFSRVAMPGSVPITGESYTGRLP
jgi:hypothetical protein